MTDKELIKIACNKLIGKEILISGICGDVERGKVLAYKEMKIIGHKRRLLFSTDNKEYDVIAYPESHILDMIDDKKKVTIIDKIKEMIK